MRLLPHPILSLSLAVIWLLLVNRITPGQIVLGGLLGWLIPLFSQAFWPDRVAIRKPLVLLRFIATVMWDIAAANLIVARLILGNPARLNPAFISMPLALRSDLAISLLANTICLTPGTVSAELAPDRKTLLIHALDVTDSAALIASIRQRYEKPLQAVFESC